MYWIGGAGTVPGNANKPATTTYNFNTGFANAAFSPTLATGSNNSANWSISPPVANDSRNTVYFMPFSAVETLSSGNQTGTGGVSFGSIAQGISFAGLVTFQTLNTELADASGTDITTIHGSKITTGIISSISPNGTDLSNAGALTTSGSYFNLANGAIATPGFRVEPNGTAEFAGTISGSSKIGSTSGDKISVGANENIVIDGNTKLITIKEDGGAVRVKLGYLGT